jgi:dipeptidase E
MKLYLSSQGFGNHLRRLQQMVGDDRRVLFVDNAKDGLPTADRATHVAEKKAEFEAAGFDFFELDLRNYFDNNQALHALVTATPFVWVSGGNTFVLRRAFAYSGFDELLKRELRKDTLTYGGSSAGSIVMTKTLRGTEHGDDPYEMPEGYHPEILWDGLGLVYPQLVPHYGSDWFGKEAQAMEDYMKENGLEYETLKDSEVYVVDGKYEEKLT